MLTKNGFAWFSIDYRLAPAVRFPLPVEDVNNAIRWVKTHAAEYHVDPAKLVLIGESAGAYLITYAATHETPETKLAAVSLISEWRDRTMRGWRVCAKSRL